MFTNALLSTMQIFVEAFGFLDTCVHVGRGVHEGVTCYLVIPLARPQDVLFNAWFHISSTVGQRTFQKL